jgi:hypothetical protein
VVDRHAIEGHSFSALLLLEPKAKFLNPDNEVADLDVWRFDWGWAFELSERDVVESQGRSLSPEADTDAEV